MSQAQLEEAADSKAPAARPYYVLRVRKRNAHGLAVVAVMWFLWNEGGEVVKLIGNLVHALS